MAKITPLALLMLAGTNPAQAKGEMAAYTAPIPITAQSQPYHGGMPDTIVAAQLAAHNYVEEEYLVSGTWQGLPYRTMVEVRKPADPREFSGLVVVEPIHIEGVTAMWLTYNQAIMDGGHGWMAIGSQKISAEGVLKKAEPGRYADVSIPLAPGATGGPEPLIEGGPQDKFNQAILTQFGMLLKSNPRSGPFAGQPVKYTVLAGGSQTGVLTLRYIRQSGSTARLPGGKPVWDAYYPTQTPVSTRISGGPSIVMHVFSEGDLMMFKGLSGGQPRFVRPDSDAPNDRFRSYEVPAGSHIPTRSSGSSAMLAGALGAALPGKMLSQYPTVAIYNACFSDLIRWVTQGVRPPHSTSITMANGEIVRDTYGNAQGGVRSPYLDLPAYRYIASNAPADKNLMLSAVGVQEPLPVERLTAQYGSRTHYLELFDAQIDRMVADRFLLPADASLLKADEAAKPPF